MASEKIIDDLSKHGVNSLEDISKMTSKELQRVEAEQNAQASSEYEARLSKINARLAEGAKEKQIAIESENYLNAEKLKLELRQLEADKEQLIRGEEERKSRRRRSLAYSETRGVSDSRPDLAEFLLQRHLIRPQSGCRRLLLGLFRVPPVALLLTACAFCGTTAGLYIYIQTGFELSGQCV